MADRGRNETVELPADFNQASIRQAVEHIYSSFRESSAPGDIAIIVQARIHVQAKGHISNERRVSITENRWMCEVERGYDTARGFNSQRAKPAASDKRLMIRAPAEKSLVAQFRALGRWCTHLGLGRVHLEWGATTDTLWVFQIDFEDDLPDDGHHPADLLRGADLRSSVKPGDASPFRSVDNEEKTGWKKIDKVADFLVDRADPYPKLFWITGDRLAEALLDREGLRSDLEKIVHGRAICRTDCRSPLIPSLNLPRPESVSEDDAVSFMDETLRSLGLRGARAEEVCFILHKFIPATAAAWAVASPDSQTVRVDALWGLPDGLQYLPHDTFEYDVLRNELSAERIRYKPKFLQETADGTWKVVQVGRRFTRQRSLSKADLAEVATHTQAIATRIGRPIQVMWFCGIPEELEIGRNVPWFSMPPEAPSHQDATISPTMPRFNVHGPADLSAAMELEERRHVLVVNPEDPELFRDNNFLDMIASVSETKDFPILLEGSILSHAFYMLDRKGLVVAAADQPSRARTRQRRVFNKIVRDQIPEQISRKGERSALATIAKGEARPALAVKLLEELFELLQAQTPNEVTAELADVLEVVRALGSATGVDWQEVQSHAAEKREKRGSFDRNVVLVETSLASGWGDIESRETAQIKLSDLDRVRSDDGRHTIPYSVLLAEDGKPELTLSDGRRVVVAMNGNAVILQEGSLHSGSTKQLELDLR